jgi:hypothetical protein
MNRRRNETRTPLSVYLSLFLAAALVAAGGVLHAFYKNRQVQISHEIKAIDGRVAECRLDIKNTDVKMEQLLNRFVIRKEIAANGSSLRPIPIGVAEEIGSNFSARHNVASATP